MSSSSEAQSVTAGTRKEENPYTFSRTVPGQETESGTIEGSMSEINNDIVK
jgi:hypothetical protein